MRAFLTLVLVLALALLSCEGKVGPTGPQGTQGIDGEDGAGTRIIYYTNEPFPDQRDYCITVPEITPNDMPLVTCYVSFPGVGIWHQLPAWDYGTAGYGESYYLYEGHVCFAECSGRIVKIVIVI